MTPDPQAPCPDPDKVTQTPELDMLADLYCACISGEWPAEGDVQTFTANQTLKKCCGKCDLVILGIPNGKMNAFDFVMTFGSVGH